MNEIERLKNAERKLIWEYKQKKVASSETVEKAWIDLTNAENDYNRIYARELRRKEHITLVRIVDSGANDCLYAQISIPLLRATHLFPKILKAWMVYCDDNLEPEGEWRIIVDPLWHTQLEHNGWLEKINGRWCLMFPDESYVEPGDGPNSPWDFPLV